MSTPTLTSNQKYKCECNPRPYIGCYIGSMLIHIFYSGSSFGGEGFYQIANVCARILFESCTSDPQFHFQDRQGLVTEGFWEVARTDRCLARADFQTEQLAAWGGARWRKRYDFEQLTQLKADAGPSACKAGVSGFCGTTIPMETYTFLGPALGPVFNRIRAHDANLAGLKNPSTLNNPSLPWGEASGALWGEVWGASLDKWRKAQ